MTTPGRIRRVTLGWLLAGGLACAVVRSPGDGDTTLVIRYRRGKDALNTWMVYWPRHLLEGLDPKGFWEWEFWVRPVGNGPYRYVRHVPKTMVELQANPDFFAGTPRIGRAIIRFGGGSPITELLGGNVDAAWSNHADLPKMATDPRFRVYHQLSPEVPWLKVVAWNHRHVALGDVRVRRALTAAVDRRELIRLQNFPAELRLADALYTPRQYRRDELPATIPHDPEAARRMLDQAGWRDADGDGIRERAGRPLRMTLMVGEGRDAAAAVYLQAAWRRIGVDLLVSQIEGQVRSTRFSAGDFDAAIMPFWNHPDGHSRWFRSLPGEPRDPAARRGLGYQNPEVIRLMDAARLAFDLGERDRIYQQATPLFLRDQPVLFLYPEPQPYVVTRRLQGLVPPYRADPIQFLQHLWLENPR